MTVTVAPMRRRHLPAVVTIEEQVYLRPWSLALFEDELARSARLYLVARVGERVVGYAGLLLIAGDGHVSTVAVDPAWQGRSVATRLLVELLGLARRSGVDQATLEVRSDHPRAQRLYQRFGFVPAGMRKGYYPDGQDALVMWAHDLGSDAYGERIDAIAADLPSPTIRHGLDDLGPGRAHPALGAAGREVS